MEENLKENSVNELKHKKFELTKQLDEICTEIDERKRRDVIIAELYHKFNYIGTLDDFIKSVDKFDLTSLCIIELLLNENRDLKYELRNLQQNKTCKISPDEYVGRNEGICK